MKINILFEGFTYSLRGTTGVESISTVEGKNKINLVLSKNSKQFVAQASTIIVTFKNDACCNPDRNVIFTSDYPYSISLGNNPREKRSWKCDSNCGKNTIYFAWNGDYTIRFNRK